MTSARDPSAELEEALQLEQRYQQIQQAKKNAASEAVDYETFHNRVLTAHLKPVNAPSSSSSSSSSASSSTFAAGTMPHQMLDTQQERVREKEMQMSQELLSATGGRGSSLQARKPTQAFKFARDWGRAPDAEARLAYLRLLDLEELHSVFPAGFEMLGEVVLMLAEHEGALREDAELAAWVLALLEAVRTTARFDMMVMFLEEAEQTALRGVLEAIRVSVDSASEIDGVLAAYKLL